MGKTSYPLRLPSGEYDRIIKIALARGMTIAEWLRRAVREKMERDQH
jgi:hypothetical protein